MSIKPNETILVRTRVNSGARDEYGSPTKTVAEKAWPVLWAWGASSTERTLQYSLEKNVATIYCFKDGFAIEADAEIVYKGEVFRPSSKVQQWEAPQGFKTKTGYVVEVAKVVNT